MMYTMPHDKALHFIAGVLLFAAFHFINEWVGLAAAIAYGIGKEVYDKVSGKGNPELLDAIYTIAGGGVGLICWI